LSETLPALQNDTTSRSIGVSLNNTETIRIGVLLMYESLIIQRILLVFRGHPKVLCSGNQQIGSHVVVLLLEGYRLNWERL
jgi:hypothetical protein